MVEWMNVRWRRLFTQNRRQTLFYDSLYLNLIWKSLEYWEHEIKSNQTFLVQNKCVSTNCFSMWSRFVLVLYALIQAPVKCSQTHCFGSWQNLSLNFLWRITFHIQKLWALGIEFLTSFRVDSLPYKCWLNFVSNWDLWRTIIQS
jgi:hypothetical protein